MAIIQGNAKASGGFYPKEIEQSLRFNRADGAYIQRTPTTNGNSQTFTFSAWIKLGNLDTGADSFIFSSGDAALSQQFDIHWKTYSGSCELRVGFGGKAVKTFAVLRDTSSWYHLVVEVDTTNATTTDRIKVYLNGVRQSMNSISTDYPSLNESLGINLTTRIMYVGGLQISSTVDRHWEGYLADVHFTDGTAYDATAFGEFKNGVWVAKAFTGSYGTNGFYLDFADGGAIGNDVSGNNNDWTATNLASTDVMLDSPTNNFATLNPLSRINWIGQDYATLAEGNLQNNGSNNGNHIDSTMAFSSGKWYWETMVGQYGFAGVRATHAVYNADGTYRYYNNDGNITYGDPASSSYGSTIGDYASGTAGDVIGVAIDCDSNEIKFYRNNSLLHTQSSIGAWEYSPITGCAATSNQVINFGQDSSFAGNKVAQGNTDANGRGDFYYAPPAGYLALCTANLPEPAIGPNSSTTADEHFSTILWTGDGTSSRSITGVGFQPDLLWVRQRNIAQSHALSDAVIGAGVIMTPNGTNAEYTATTYGQVSSFDSDGFTATKGSDPTYSYYNISGGSYVAWNWKANGSGVSNTDGSITSTVSANVDAGFSIVSWTSTGASESIGHGLGGQPELLIFKSRANADGWFVWTTGFNSSEYLLLNSTSAKLTYSTVWSTVPNSTVFGTTAASLAAGDAIAYCFHSVEGFSKFGSYTGNGSTDGPFVYTGFRPAFVMVKRTDAADHWWMTDSARDSDNVVERWLYASSSGAEVNTSWDPFDYLSNGFKLRNSDSGLNANGGTFIYMAFAENPFKYSNAR